MAEARIVACHRAHPPRCRNATEGVPYRSLVVPRHSVGPPRRLVGGWFRAVAPGWIVAAAVCFAGARVSGQALPASPPPEADWARAMFDQTSHDFGVVARGAKVEYRFVVKNPYNEDMQIESVRSSCGCSAAEATKQHLKGAKDFDPAPLDQAEIVVRVDTRGIWAARMPRSP